jgi:hypothetical protein
MAPGVTSYSEYGGSLDDSTNGNRELTKSPPDVADRSDIALKQVKGTPQCSDISSDALRYLVSTTTAGYDGDVLGPVGS